jgi:hypothetical protein
MRGVCGVCVCVCVCVAVGFHVTTRALFFSGGLVVYEVMCLPTNQRSFLFECKLSRRIECSVSCVVRAYLHQLFFWQFSVRSLDSINAHARLRSLSICLSALCRWIAPSYPPRNKGIVMTLFSLLAEILFLMFDFLCCALGRKDLLL